MTYAHIYVIPDQGNMTGGDLYDKFGNLSFFADVTALVDKTQTGVDLTVPVKAFNRERFMRDPAPYSVSATTRYVSMNIRQTKGGIPGVTITLKTEANISINMFGPTGTPYDPIPAAP